MKRVCVKRSLPSYDRMPHACECGNHGFVGLTRGSVALVDVDDIGIIEGCFWFANKDSSRGVYARSNVIGGSITMHRLIAGPSEINEVVDHRNGDGLDNRRANLRVCTAAENNLNKRVAWGRSRFRGVSRSGNRWRFCIQFNHKKYRGDGFLTEELAAKAYDDLAIKLHGDFACTNQEMGRFNQDKVK